MKASILKPRSQAPPSFPSFAVWKSGRGPGIIYHVNDVEGREDLTERRRNVDVLTHVIAYRSIIDSTHSRVLVGARSGSFFGNNNGREDLSKA